MSDAVTDWNDVLLNVIRDVGGPPGPISRGGAMVHGAIYDAVNSIVPTHEPYLYTTATNPSASVDAAVAYAAHDTLAAAFPSTTVDLAQRLTDALSALSEPATSLAAGKALGKAAAQAMIVARSGDGADDATPYFSDANPADCKRPGDWRETGSGPAASPNWPRVKPFGIASGSQFRPPRPGGYLSKTEMLSSSEYAASSTRSRSSARRTRRAAPPSKPRSRSSGPTT